MGTGQPYYERPSRSQTSSLRHITSSKRTSPQAQIKCAPVDSSSPGAMNTGRGGNDNTQQGGGAAGSLPAFEGGSWAGSYDDEAGFGVNSAVQMSRYGKVLPINRTQFKGYNAIKKLYQASVEDSRRAL